MAQVQKPIPIRDMASSLSHLLRGGFELLSRQLSLESIATRVSAFLPNTQVPIVSRPSSEIGVVKMKNLMTTIIAGSQYLLHPQKLGTIQETINPDALIPVTLLSTEEIFGDNLEITLERFAAFDDVFLPTFGDVLVEKTAGNDTNSKLTVRQSSPSQDVYHLSRQIQALEQLGDLPSGPYILYGPNLYQAWKLYEDELDAFAFGVIPENVKQPTKFRALSSLSDNGDNKAVGVPSRLYFEAPTTEKPLSGVRISITDPLELNGVITGLSSHAYSQIYGTASPSSSEFAKTLIDLGAVIVGKTRSSPMLSGREWVDEQKPWNPRSDEYQNPPLNSAGAAPALAGYEWLERSIGQSSIEGLISNAATAGVFSLRTTFKNETLKGAEASSKHYDTVALNSRDLLSLELMTSALEGTDSRTTLPKRLLYPEDLFLAFANPDGQNNTSEFLASLENLLGIKAQTVNLAKLWAQEPPTGSGALPLAKYLQKAPFESYAYEYYHAFDSFRTVYQRRFKEAPFVEATPKYRWAVGTNVTESVYAEHLNKIQIFRDWFGKKVMSVEENDAIMVLPCEAKQTYRDTKAGPPTFIKGITPEILSAILGAPHLATPFTQVPFQSRISGKTEYRPVCGSVMGHKGGDSNLVNVVRKAFETAQWRTKADTGSLTFPL